jgi:hypothetical protein
MRHWIVLVSNWVSLPRSDVQKGVHTTAAQYLCGRFLRMHELNHVTILNDIFFSFSA